VAEREALHGVDARLDASVVLGDLATLLAQGAVPEALEALVAGLGLRTAVLRTASGAALGGVSAVPGEPTVELPVHGRSDTLVATLTVTGATPDRLPALRSAAAVLGLALAPLSTEDEAERDELADALHDGPVQALVVARYACDAAVRGGDTTVARDAVQGALVELRRFLWHLRPRGAGGLMGALDQLSAQLVEAGGAPVGVLGDATAATALRGPAAVTAYRLVQAVARPDAGAVRVTLRTDGRTLRMDVEGGAALPSPDRWLRRVQAHGGDLSSVTGRIRLVLPNPEARTDS
jgi:signal transduction histidine kinase